MSVEPNSSFMVTCPKCSKEHNRKNMPCKNCANESLIVKSVTQTSNGRPTLTSSFLECRNCATAHPHYYCSDCGAEIAALLRSNVSEKVHEEATASDFGKNYTIFVIGVVILFVLGIWVAS